MGFRSPLPSFAVTGTAPVAGVKLWPPPEFLEPIYELKLSVDALEKIAAGTGKDTNAAKKWLQMKTKLDRFVSPKGMRTSMSERDTYREIALEYTSRIQYTDGNIKNSPTSTTMNKAMDNALVSLESLRKALETALTADTVNDDIEMEIERCAREARGAMADWFERIPKDQVQSVAKLIEDVRSADHDRDGWLNGLELAKLPSDERGIWERRVGIFGRSKVERNLGFKLTEQSYN
jgi:hypothetical protein